jgi:hypothetical protein
MPCVCMEPPSACRVAVGKAGTTLVTMCMVLQPPVRADVAGPKATAALITRPASKLPPAAYPCTQMHPGSLCKDTSTAAVYRPAHLPLPAASKLTPSGMAEQQQLLLFPWSCAGWPSQDHTQELSPKSQPLASSQTFPRAPSNPHKLPSPQPYLLALLPQPAAPLSSTQLPVQRRGCLRLRACICSSNRSGSREGSDQGSVPG